MFRRDIKKQFNENKYNLLTQKGEQLFIYNNIRYLLENKPHQCRFPKEASWVNCIDGDWF